MPDEFTAYFGFSFSNCCAADVRGQYWLTDSPRFPTFTMIVLSYTKHKIAMKHFIQYTCLLIALACFGCADDNDDLADSNAELFEEQQQTIDQYLQERNIVTQENASGIHYRVLTENSSGTTPQPGNTVNLYYRIEQLDGQLVDALEDSSGRLPVTYTFKYASTTPQDIHLIVPISLDEIVSLMKEGEEYEFYLPSAWAYLDLSLTNRIDANAIVRARISLANVFSRAEQRQAEDQRISAYLAENNLTDPDSLTSGVYYVQTRAGNDTTTIVAGNRVQLRYTGTLLDGTVFDSNAGQDREPFNFTVGQVEFIEGFSLAIRQMSEGEKGTVVIPSHAAYGQGVMAIPYEMVNVLIDQNSPFRQIPPYSPLRFDIEIVSVE